MADDLIGKRIGNYEILDVIGRGGMATVYRARQLTMDRIVALKVLPRQFVNDDTYLQRFHREVEIVARLEHRNIVPVHDFGEFEGQPYIVMRYMPGGSVDDLLAHGPLDSDKYLSIIEQIAPALDYAHSKNVLHRDLKPSNVLMDDGGGAYLTDFGIARIVGEAHGPTITTQGVVGTPSYMSPEQAQGLPLDARSDVYALGVMLFEMATGQRPFRSDTPYSIAVLQVTAQPPAPRSINNGVSIAVEQVILRALRKKPAERYASATALAEALRRAVAPPAASVHDTQPGIPRPTKPNPVQQQAAPMPQPAVVPPPPVYAPSGYTPPAYTPAPARPVPRRPLRRRGGGLLMSAAVGGLIGCGLLTLIVVIAALVISGLQAADWTDESQPGAAPLALTVYSGDALIPTLDLTSEAYRQGLLGGGAAPTPTPPPTAAVTLPELPAQPAQPAAPAVTPTLPVGWRTPNG